MHISSSCTITLLLRSCFKKRLNLEKENTTIYKKYVIVANKSYNRVVINRKKYKIFVELRDNAK